LNEKAYSEGSGNMMKWPYAEWARAGIDAWALGLEASTVIGLRMATFAQGGAASEREARLMVAEKIESALHLQSAFLGGRLGNTPASGAKRVLRHYRRKVSANRRRLG
jgi:hypothetical protein